MKDMSEKERFIERRAEGWSFDRIASELNLSKQTLINWSREFQLEIANLKALRLDSLRERYAVGQAKRVELFGKTLDRLDQELAKRDFDNVSTEKLSDLKLKYLGALRHEDTPVELREQEDRDAQFLKTIGKTEARWQV